MQKVRDYLFIPSDIPVFWRWLRGQFHLGHLNGLIVLVVVFLVLRLFFGVTGEGLFFGLYIVAMLFWKVSGRISIVLALVCLVSLPVLMTLYNRGMVLTGEYWAERVAVWAYYFLALGVLWQIVAQIRQRVDERVSDQQPVSIQPVSPVLSKTPPTTITSPVTSKKIITDIHIKSKSNIQNKKDQNH